MKPGEKYEKNGRSLIIDAIEGHNVYYRTWIDNKFNGFWRKNIEEFEELFKEWIGVE